MTNPTEHYGTQTAGSHADQRALKIDVDGPG